MSDFSVNTIMDNFLFSNFYNKDLNDDLLPKVDGRINGRDKQ